MVVLYFCLPCFTLPPVLSRHLSCLCITQACGSLQEISRRTLQRVVQREGRHILFLPPVRRKCQLRVWYGSACNQIFRRKGTE